MSAKPTVTLTFAGDETKLTESMARVGGSTEKLGSSVGSASDKMKESGGHLENLTEKSDTAEQRFIGMSDIIGGVTDGFAAWGDESLTTTEKVQQIGMAMADLAGGLANFLLPVLGQVTSFMKVQLTAAMSFVAAHPLMFAILALVAVFILLWTQSETFRRIVIDAFNAVGRFIRDVFGTAIGWIVDRWNDMINWFGDLPGKIGRALGAIGRFIGDAFKGGLNVAIDVINWFVDRANDIIHGINIISPFADIPNIGHIGRLHTGGIVPGAPGSERLAILQAGEQVLPVGASAGAGGGGTVTFAGDTDGALATVIMKLVRDGTITIAA